MMSSFTAEDMSTPAQADPFTVARIIDTVWMALESTLPDEVSQADVVSAVLTVLDRLLRVGRSHLSVEDRVNNSVELQRILSMMLMEFGTGRVH